MTILADPAPLHDQRLARLLVRPLMGTPVTPNAVTALSLVIGLAGAWLFARGGALVHLGALLFMIATLLDHVDGELARMTGQTSWFGHYFDLAAGGAVLVALFIGIGIGLEPAAFGGHAPLMGVLAGVAIAIIFTVRLELERRAGKAATRQPRLNGFEIEDVMYLVGPITWLGGLRPFLALAALGAPLYALVVLWSGRHLLRARPGR